LNSSPSIEPVAVGKKIQGILLSLQHVLGVFMSSSDPTPVPEQFLFTLLVHCASSVPQINEDAIPSPFFTAKTTVDAKEKRPAKAATVAISNAK
jgi:hypothetical protein